jgi:hypothetical protein
MPTNNQQEQPTVPTVGGEDIHRMLEEALKKKQKQDKRKSTSKRHSSKRTSRSSRSHGATATAVAAGVPVGATVKGSGAGGTIKGSGPGMPAEKFDPKATTSGDAFFAQFKAKQDKSYGPRYHG